MNFPRCTCGYCEIRDGRLKVTEVFLNEDDKKKQFGEKMLIGGNNKTPEPEQEYSAAVIFHRGKSTEETAALTSAVMDHLTDEKELLLYAPNTLFDQQKTGFREMITKKNFAIISATLVSNEGFKSYKKYTLAEITANEGGTEEEKATISKLISYEEASIPKAFLMPWGAQIPKNELTNSDKTLARLFRTYRSGADNAPQEKKKRKTSQYKFSREIVMSYSWSKKGQKGETYYRASPTKTQKRNNKTGRGKAITEPKYFGAATLREAYGKIEKILFSGTQAAAIIEDISRAFEDKPVSLKTFWYCSRQLLKNNQLYQDAIACKIFSLPGPADFLSDERHEDDEYLSFVEENFADRTKEYIDMVWDQFDVILKRAQHQGRFTEDTVNEYVRDRRKQQYMQAAVNSALKKNYFTHEEEKMMLKILSARLLATEPDAGENSEDDWLLRTLKKLRRVDDGLLIGVAIRLFTGMMSREVRALQWNDFEATVDCSGKYHLVISKALDREDKKLYQAALDDSINYRFVPVAPPLDKMLLLYRDRMREKLGLNGKELGSRYIVTNTEGTCMTPCRFDRLKGASKKMIEAIGINPLLMDFPNEKGESRTVDLNGKRVDLFRSNFKSRMHFDCLMSQGERNFVIGDSMPNTLMNNYLDLNAPMGQCIMTGKMERWTSTLLLPEGKGTNTFQRREFEIKSSQAYTVGYKGETTEPLTVEIELTIESSKGDPADVETELGILISALHGADISAGCITRDGEK